MKGASLAQIALAGTYLVNRNFRPLVSSLGLSVAACPQIIQPLCGDAMRYRT